MAKTPKSRKPPRRASRKSAGPARGNRRSEGTRGQKRQKGASKPSLPRSKARAAVRARGTPATAFTAPAAPVPAEKNDGEERALSAVAAGRDKKAEEPVILDVRGLSGVADYFVVMSADSDRQAAAIADAVDERLEGLGAVRLGTEGRSGGGWVLLDYGSVVVHVMGPDTRRFYDLEGLWADAPRVEP
jgi:ribosome-associated protein